MYNGEAPVRILRIYRSIMSSRIRALPVLQNWDCHACGTCCHEYQVFVTESERQTILQQGWERDEQLARVPLFVRHGPPWAPRYRLNQRASGACIFLADNGRCRIHERYGGRAKPLACQLYPFILIPASNQWRLSLRFSCPSTVQSRGRPVGNYQDELTRFAKEIESTLAAGPRGIAPPRMAGRRRLEWDDVFRLVEALAATLQKSSEPFEYRFRKAIALASLCRHANLYAVRGGRLDEFLSLMQGVVESDVPTNPFAVPEPTTLGRMLFRLAIGMHARRDQGPHRNLELGRLSSLRAGCRFLRGKGRIPRVHGDMPERLFEQAEESAGPMPAEAEALLERYYLIKLTSLQFCGAANADLPFWEGLDALYLTLPIILWLRRMLRPVSAEIALAQAISMVDHNFGYNPILRRWNHRMSIRLMARRGELDRLTAWYSR
jgi:lysine-N-methylase